jgi:PAS domain S-box-containing protein
LKGEFLLVNPETTVGDGVTLVDGSGRIRLWNAAAARITGLENVDVLGKHVDDALPGWSAVTELIPADAGDGSVRADNVSLQVGGRRRRLSISALGYDEGTVYTFRDLTDDGALETMHQDLVATVSHELRKPLAAIYGAALTLRRDDVVLAHDLQDQLLEVVVDQSSRLVEIVNNLLVASQLNSGTLRVTIERCDPRELAILEIDATRTHLPETIEVVLHAAGDIPPVAADPSQLRQVLGNLIENAIKYSPGGGTIEVTLEPVDRHVRFGIRDPGLGIPESEQRRIFERFYRLHTDTTRGIRGTGLGLYICRELVSRVDGRIWVESDGRSGSTFVVEIPQEATVPEVVSHRGVTTSV